jgi:hypothetical protein
MLLGIGQGLRGHRRGVLTCCFDVAVQAGDVLEDRREERTQPARVVGQLPSSTAGRAPKAAKDAAIAAHGDGVTEVDIAQTIGVNRMTVRKWLGKL